MTKKKDKKNIYIVVVTFNIEFCGFIHWHQSQEYHTFMDCVIFTNVRVGNIHR
jgi:hypothetical protein